MGIELFDVNLISCFVHFLKTALGISSLLWFHVHFRSICFSSVKGIMGVLVGIMLNLYITLGSMTILAILILSVHVYGISLYHLHFPSSVFYSFQSIGVLPLSLSLFLGILFSLMQF